jgi:hypothetical protein
VNGGRGERHELRRSTGAGGRGGCLRGLGRRQWGGATRQYSRIAALLIGGATPRGSIRSIIAEHAAQVWEIERVECSVHH